MDFFRKATRGGKPVASETPVEVVAAGAGAGEPLPVYPVIRVNGKPASQSFDFPPSVNLSNKTDRFRNTTYSTLRWFANNHLVSRAAINVRKKEIVGLDWDIVGKDDAEPSGARLKQIKEFWASPDRRADFAQWLNRLLEDLFVVDAPAIEIRTTRNGEFYGLDVIDGTTIKINLDDSGRVRTDERAYDQIIRGQVICSFSPRELIYNPYNDSTSSPYGRSFLESALLETNTTLRALTQLLSFFTEGTVPPGFITGPPRADAKALGALQDYFDALMAGNDAQRSKLIVIPGGSDYIAAKDLNFSNFTELKDYLNQEILMAFEVQPQEVGLTYQVNKSTGEQQENITFRRSIKPIVRYLEDLFYRVNRDWLGAPDVALKFYGLEAEDKLLQAQVHDIYSQNRVMTTNEIRSQIGLDPIEGGDELAAPPAPSGLFAFDWAEVEKELEKYERKAIGDIGRVRRPFISDILPSEVCAEIEAALPQASTAEEIKTVFATVKKKYQEQSFGRRFPALSKKMSRLSGSRLKNSTGNGGRAFSSYSANPYRHSSERGF